MNAPGRMAAIDDLWGRSCRIVSPPDSLQLPPGCSVAKLSPHSTSPQELLCVHSVACVDELSEQRPMPPPRCLCMYQSASKGSWTQRPTFTPCRTGAQSLHPHLGPSNRPPLSAKPRAHLPEGLLSARLAQAGSQVLQQAPHCAAIPRPQVLQQGLVVHRPLALQALVKQRAQEGVHHPKVGLGASVLQETPA